MDEMIKEVRKELLENQYVKELEILHIVDIQTEAVDLACSIVGRFFEAIFVKRGKAHCCIPDLEMLRFEALWILEKASLELKDDEDTELLPILREGYLMLRNLVELSEFRKDKPARRGFSYSYLAYLEKEKEILSHSWDEVVVNCKPVLLWQKNPERLSQLVKLRESVCQILKSDISGDKIISTLRDIHTLLNEYKRSIPATVMQYRAVSPRMVAKVASPLTGVPTSWLLNSFRPPVAGLVHRLARKMVGEDDAVRRVANIMSRPRSSGNGPSPLASFLFLPFSWMRLEEFFESLVEELYDSKDRLTWFNLRIDTKNSDVDIRDQWDAIQEKMIEVIKSTPFCALLFENVDASEYAIAFVENTLKHGKLVDKQGKTYDLSNTLIIMTSMFHGHTLRQALNCNCKYLETDCAMVENGSGTVSSKDIECERLLLHKKVLGSLWDIHELVDDVLVLKGIPLLDREVITRVKLRNALDAPGKDKQLILYPSEAVVQHIKYSYEDDCLESCIKKAILPDICDGIKRMQPLNMDIIHMDALVGSMKFSYRPLGLGGGLAAFKESLSQLEAFYQNEKRSAAEIVKLSTLCSQLLPHIQNRAEPDLVAKGLVDMENILDGLISHQINFSKFRSELDLVLPEIEAKIPDVVTTDSYSNIMEGLVGALGEKNRLLNLITNVISSTQSAGARCCNPKSFLFVGLTDKAKTDLFIALSHLCESEDVCEPVIQINMEEYTNSDSLMQFVDHIAGSSLHGSSGIESSLSDRTRTSDCRLLLIDRVGEADVSVFSALLSVMEDGALANREGKLVDFCRTVIIITSDIGNKQILAALRGHAVKCIIKEENADQRTKEDFRFELVNRIDEIVLFDPTLEQDQLEKFYRFRMKMHVVVKQKLELIAFFRFLTWNLDDDIPAEKREQLFGVGVTLLARAINASWNNTYTVVRKRKFSAA